MSCPAIEGSSRGGWGQPALALPASPTTGCLVAITCVSLLSQVQLSVITHRTQSLVLGLNFNPESPEKKKKKIRKCSHSSSLSGDMLPYGSLQRSSVSSTWMKARPAGWLGGPAGGVRTTRECCDG